MTTAHDYPPIDRSAWAAGPWDGEPDRVEFKTEAGYPALVQRVMAGHLCGYVAVPPGHPMHGVHDCSDEANAYDVHGQITYGSKCHGLVCHVPEPGASDDVWWLGFDAAHGFDSSPMGGMGNPFFILGDGAPHVGHENYRTVEFMRAECEKLAAQLKSAEVAT